VPGADNRDLVDTNTSQTLTSDDIAAMKAAGHAGEKIISALVENSATFATKTAFSQEKYIRKKQLKYVDDQR
jgi:tRNA (adenine-N(1)-)-methyltransferase non-catalytic subunit